RREPRRRVHARRLLGGRHRRDRARPDLRPLRALRPERRRHLRDRACRPRPRRRLLRGLDAARGRDHLRPGAVDRGGLPAPELLRPVAPHAGFFSHAWWGWALVLAGVVFVISWLGVQISARILLALTAIGVTMLLI